MAQTVLITGGSRGIGAACVRTFAENGWNIAFTYSKSREAADRLAGETGALALLADQQDTAAVELAAAEVKARFGTIDAVVCNAGIAEQKLFQNITDADWMRMLDVNLMGTVRTIRAVLPEMLHNHTRPMVAKSPERRYAMTRNVTKNTSAVPKSFCSARQPPQMAVRPMNIHRLRLLNRRSSVAAPAKI